MKILLYKQTASS